MAQINGINWVFLLFGQLYFFMVSNAHYDLLNVKIKNGNEIIELNWKRTKEYLVNENLPIWFAVRDEAPALAPNIMQNIGEILTYQDIEKSSAVVYLSKFKVFYGIIDTRFYIFELPFDDELGPNINDEVGNGYIFTRSVNENKEYFHNDHENLLSELFTDDQMSYINSIIEFSRIPPASESHSLTTIQQIIDDSIATASDQISTIKPTDKQENIQQISTESHVSSSNIFYSEILIFVNNDVIIEFRKLNINDYIKLLILNYIVYFNAIDMLFAKIARNDIMMYINIAGIVIEIEPGTFSNSIKKSNQRNFDNIPQRLYADKTMFNIMRYIEKYKNTFPPDSFDFFFLSTNYVIQKRGEIVPGYSRPIIDIYAQRRDKLNDNLQGFIVQYKAFYSDFIVGTRAFAKLLTLDYDLPSEEFKNNNGNQQCGTIMQKTNSFCKNCLEWSINSQKLLKSYFWSNRNRCFLLNYPRSLRPYGYPSISIYPRHQCLCYGFTDRILDEFYLVNSHVNKCNEELKCGYKVSRKLTPFPLDGTPCDIEQDNKVCWKKKCVELGEFNTDKYELDSPQISQKLRKYHDSQMNKLQKKPRISSKIS